VVDAEVLIERPDGSRITVVVNIRALKNRRGEVTGAINCFYDITERKRAETQLADSLIENASWRSFARCSSACSGTTSATRSRRSSWQPPGCFGATS
jgi:hypothetical protein